MTMSMTKKGQQAMRVEKIEEERDRERERGKAAEKKRARVGLKGLWFRVTRIALKMSCVFFLLFVEMTKQLTGRTTMTTSGFEALFPVLTLLPERCHRRQSLVPEA